MINKDETLKLWRKIKSEKSYNDVKKMFFVDMDMDVEPADKDEDLYVTPCYSVENLYANKYCFANIIESEFSINKGETDYDKTLQLFDELFEKFCNEIENHCSCIVCCVMLLHTVTCTKFP